MPATPRPLSVDAPRMPMTRVPCQELSVGAPFGPPQVAAGNSTFFSSAALIQSPGSEGSGSQPSPSLAIKKVPSELYGEFGFTSPDTKSYPGSSPPWTSRPARSKYG